MIKYLGSKRTLLPDLLSVLREFPRYNTVLDLFSGTSRVGHSLKRAGYKVLANDHNAYAFALANCYVAADREKVVCDAEKLIKELNSLPGRPGYFTRTFCEESRFFQPKNGERVDSMREMIASKCLEPILESVLLVSLMEAADRVDSTCGLQMAYLKSWAPRAHNQIELRMPDVLPSVPAGPCGAYQLDALQAIERLESDVTYIDPPYNQHSYLSNYHIWETLVLWDQPAFYGVACKRMDCRERKSVFNSKTQCDGAFEQVIRGSRSKLLVVSFNNEGYLSRERIEQLLSTRGEVVVISKDFKRYVGAQIGIYNPQGQRVGEVSHLRNQEYIYLVSDDIPKALKQGLEKDARSGGGEVLEQVRSHRNSVAGEVPRRRENSLGQQAQLAQVVECLRGAETRSNSEIQTTTGMSASEVREVLQSLVLANRVRVHGQRRGTRYEWIDKTDIDSQQGEGDGGDLDCSVADLEDGRVDVGAFVDSLSSPTSTNGGGTKSKGLPLQVNTKQLSLF